MRYFLLFSIFFILCLNITEAQTNAGIPDASTVLVVYREPVDENDSLGLMSLAIKDYYKTLVVFQSQTSFLSNFPASQ